MRLRMGGKDKILNRFYYECLGQCLSKMMIMLPFRNQEAKRISGEHYLQYIQMAVRVLIAKGKKRTEGFKLLLPYVKILLQG